MRQMTRDLPSFPAVRAFEAAARHLSFKAAAEELHVTQSAVSHQIKSLEEFLGLTLFRRGTRSVSLTCEGQDYLEKVSRVLDDLSAATHCVRNQGPVGPLAIRSTPAFASRWLVPRINDFNRLYPDIELHISTSLERANFTDDGIDVDVRFGPQLSDALHAEPVLESSRFPVASPGLLSRTAPLRTPEDLGKCVLLHNKVADGWDEWLACAGARNVDPRPGPRFEHCNLSLRAAAEGQGVALAYGALVAPDLAAGTLVRLFDVNLPTTVIYSLVCPTSYLEHPRVAAFKDWVISAARLDNLGAEAQAAHVPDKAVG